MDEIGEDRSGGVPAELGDVTRTSAPELLTPHLVSHQKLDRLPEGSLVSGPPEVVVLVVDQTPFGDDGSGLADDLRDAGIPHSDSRNPTSKGFSDGQPEALGAVAYIQVRRVVQGDEEVA